jgi:hypothetical protein
MMILVKILIAALICSTLGDTAHNEDGFSRTIPPNHDFFASSPPAETPLSLTPKHTRTNAVYM